MERSRVTITVELEPSFTRTTEIACGSSSTSDLRDAIHAGLRELVVAPVPHRIPVRVAWGPLRTIGSVAANATEAELLRLATTLARELGSAE